MKDLLKKIGLRLIRTIVGLKSATWLIIKLTDILQINLLELALKKNGILNYTNSEVSGERYFIEVFLKKYFKKRDNENIVLFDVGANIGKYASALRNSFPEGIIYAFEPNPNSFKVLIENIINNSDKTKLLPIGFSSNSGSKLMISYKEHSGSSHTSLHKEVFDEFHNSSNNVSIEAHFSTIDEFCQENNIDKIHLLKIDTEGHELEVLKGAINMINKDKIDIIQFEFGECHVYSAVFLRDFYLILPGYKFYRLLSNRLLALGNHSPANEIFRFQNIIAIR